MEPASIQSLPPLRGDSITHSAFMSRATPAYFILAFHNTSIPLCGSGKGMPGTVASARLQPSAPIFAVPTLALVLACTKSGAEQ